MLGVTAGPANLLCHYHDEELWNLTAIQIKGRLERLWGSSVFVSISVMPPARRQIRPLWRFAKRARASAKNYLDKVQTRTPQQSIGWRSKRFGAGPGAATKL